MGLQKGRTNNPLGKPKGTKNKTTVKMKEIISSFMENKVDDVKKAFDKLVADENMFSSKVQTHNDFFKNVILSQEWFDSFIRSTTPEERCKIFFEYFKGSLF